MSGCFRRFMRYLFRERWVRNALVMALHDERLAVAAAELHGRKRLLDIGCGVMPHRPMFEQYVEQYVGLDVPDTEYDASGVDLFGSATDIPAEDGSFDVVLSTSNLEHVEEPAAALREWARVLEPGGVAIVSVPMFWHLHDQPRDFYRYTRFGLEYLLEQAGFEIDRLESVGTFWTVAATMASYHAFKYHRGPLRWFRLIHLLAGVFQLAGYVMEKVDRSEKWACLYLVVARKAERPEEA
ncbi:MAG: class I SAM-dependent methyltransferase [Planctomycetota bacterium]